MLTNLKNAADNSPESLDSLCETLKENVEPSDFNLSKQINEIWYRVKRKIPLIVLTFLTGTAFAAALILMTIYLLTKLILNLS